MNLRHATLILGLCLYPAAAALPQALSRISVDEDRPLAYATKELGRQLGVTVTFEEMEFEHPDDFHAVQWKTETLVLPKSGPFTFEYDPTRPHAAIVDSLLRAYHESFPGRYKVVEETLEHDNWTSSVFHIVPDSSKDISGNYVPRQSILDIPLSIHSTNPANIDRLLCEVLQQASKLQDADIFCIVDQAWSLLGRVVFEYHDGEAPARTLLLRLLEETGHHLSWHVNRSSSSGDYAVIFYPVSP